MNIYFIKQLETRIDDDVNTSTLLATCQPPSSVSSSSFSAGKISLARSVSAAPLSPS
ncbi:hypothetical protein T03_11948 [Trichinella britovi]|uniref:Uncharacterized protein n=1 Tax=Trichinella britovi TaxID=45882 RepID=A0A0V0YUP0_TRIBR|nr:hypothetical protein T03_11948 [Trichinella britovi]